jgi:hypothetical protein
MAQFNSSVDGTDNGEELNNARISLIFAGFVIGDAIVSIKKSGTRLHRSTFSSRIV